MKALLSEICYTILYVLILYYWLFHFDGVNQYFIDVHPHLIYFAYILIVYLAFKTISRIFDILKSISILFQAKSANMHSLKASVDETDPIKRETLRILALKEDFYVHGKTDPELPYLFGLEDGFEEARNEAVKETYNAGYERGVASRQNADIRSAEVQRVQQERSQLIAKKKELTGE